MISVFFPENIAKALGFFDFSVPGDRFGLFFSMKNQAFPGNIAKMFSNLANEINQLRDPDFCSSTALYATIVQSNVEEHTQSGGP